MDWKITALVCLGALILFSGCVQPSKTYTATEVWENRNLLLNQRITVEGTADYYAVACTERVCIPPDTCCNSCGGGVGLRVDEDRVLSVHGESEEKGDYGLFQGEQVGCRGKECDIKCYPLEKGKKYTLTGVLRKITWGTIQQEYEEFYLELERIK